MWCKTRAIEIWREHVRKWRILKRVSKIRARKSKEGALKKWIRWNQGMRSQI